MADSNVFNVFKVPGRVVNSLYLVQSSLFAWLTYLATVITIKGRYGDNILDCVADVEADHLKAINRWCLSYGLYVEGNGVGVNYYFWFPYILTAHATVTFLSARVRLLKEGGVMEGILNYLRGYGLLASGRSPKPKPAEESGVEKEKIVFGAALVGELNHLRNQNPVEEDISPERIRQRCLAALGKVLGARVEGRCNVSWSASLIVCEILNMTVQLVLFALYDLLFSGHYRQLGFSLTSNDHLFPTTGTCHFYKIGSSGSRVAQDAVCVLGQNYLYKYIFLLLWWSNVFFICSGFAVVLFRFCEAVSFKLCCSIFSCRFDNSILEHKTLQRMSYMDYLFFKYLHDNVGSSNFRQICKNIVWTHQTTVAPTEKFHLMTDDWV